MKIKSIRPNNQKRAFEVLTARGWMDLPYSRAEPTPSSADPIVDVYIDPELGSQGFTYTLRSGQEGSLPVDAVLEYNRDPRYMRDLLLYRLTSAALDCLERTKLSKREIMRRLGTSPAQFYRLVDTTNYRKSIDQMVSLLQVLDCEVDLVVHDAPR